MTDSTADHIVDRLCSWGVNRLYGYAGDGNNALLGAVRRAADRLTFISARHEEGAAFMAVGEAKYGGGVGVVTSTQGPGAVHLLNGLYDAKLDHAPVVALVAQQQRSVLGSGYQQEINVHQLFADVASAYMETAVTADQLPMVLDRAFRAALATRQPAVVVLPHDIQQATAPQREENRRNHGDVVTAPRWTSADVLPLDEDLDRAVAVLSDSRKPAFLVGQGARDARHQVEALAELLGAGITTSLLGKPYVDETHPLVAGTMGHLGTPASARILQECDALVVIGSNDPWTEFYPAPGQARAVQIDTDSAMIGNRYPVDIGLVGHAGPTLAALSERLGGRMDQADGSWRARVEQAVADSRRISLRRAEVAADPINAERAVKCLSHRLPRNVQLAVDVGSSVYHYVRQLVLPDGASAHLSSTLASMGCAVPYAVAAKETGPERPAVVLAGDGAMEMLGNNELITVAQRWRSWSDPRFIVVVLHNRDLAEVSWEQRESESEPRFPASQDVPSIDFAAYAECLGLAGIRVTDVSSLDHALDEAFAVDRPVVVDILTDPDTPLLPPLPHGRDARRAMLGGIEAEGEAGWHAVRLLETYARIEEEFR